MNLEQLETKAKWKQLQQSLKVQTTIAIRMPMNLVLYPQAGIKARESQYQRNDD